VDIENNNPFRNEKNVRYTKGLFFEMTLPESRSSAMYTLKDWDHEVDGKTYKSLYRLYMEMNDPTEWKFATNCLDGWGHWELLCECNWFRPLVERWRKELELRMKSQALSRIMSEAKTGSREAFTANKYLLEKGWEPKDAKRGRPSKEEIRREAKAALDINSRIDEDFNRLLSVN
jgi:hypothetical protein